MRKVTVPSMESQHRYHEARLGILEKAGPSAPAGEFGLCELLPKRAWIVGESYVHPNWYVKRQKASSHQPWQATGMRQSWRARKLADDLEAKKSGELGFGDLDKRHFLSLKELDDPRLFQFEQSQQPNEVLTDPVYEFSTFHAPIKGEIPLDDPHVFYQRPKYVDLDTPLDPPKRPPQPVTVKALMVDNQVTAFVTCRANPKGDHTSDRVFKLLEETLGKCQTLLPRDEFVVLPPKGRDTMKIHGPDPHTPNPKQSQKTKKSGKGKNKNKKKNRRKLPVKPVPIQRRSQSQPNRELDAAMRSEEIPDRAWFGEPGTPLELAPDLLKLRELKGQERRKAAEQILLTESSKAEILEAVKWRDLAKKHWKHKRQRNILERYLYEQETKPKDRKKDISRKETLPVEPDIPDEDNVFEFSESLEAVCRTASGQQLPQTAFKMDSCDEQQDPVTTADVSGDHIHLPNNANEANDSDWIDDQEFSKLADDPVADQRYASSQKDLKLRTAVPGANILSSVMDNEHFMSEKNVRNLARAFRRLGLSNVQINEHMNSETEFVSAVPFIVDHSIEKDQDRQKPLLNSVVISRNHCGQEVNSSGLYENVDVSRQSSPHDEVLRPFCTNRAVPVKIYEKQAASEWDFLYKLINTGDTVEQNKISLIE